MYIEVKDAEYYIELKKKKKQLQEDIEKLTQAREPLFAGRMNLKLNFHNHTKYSEEVIYFENCTDAVLGAIIKVLEDTLNNVEIAMNNLQKEGKLS